MRRSDDPQRVGLEVSHGLLAASEVTFVAMSSINASGYTTG